MAPLVFKTSLGIVRFPEGSTPSLLRHETRAKLTTCCYCFSRNLLATWMIIFLILRKGGAKKYQGREFCFVFDKFSGPFIRTRWGMFFAPSKPGGQRYK